MGKTTTAKMFADMGVPSFNADKAVHELYAKNGEAVIAIQQKIPGVVINQTVDREALTRHLADNPDDFMVLEQLVHPLVAKAREQWLQEQKRTGSSVVLFDIPLLFENQMEKSLDFVVLATAPKNVQRSRVLIRKNMNEQKFEQILNRQMPDEEKRKKAHYIVETGNGMENARLQVKAILRHIKQNNFKS